MIIRSKNRPSMVPAEAYNDERMSYGALGLLTYINSLPEGTELNVEVLAYAHTQAEYLIDAYLKELTVLGYVTT